MMSIEPKLGKNAAENIKPDPYIYYNNKGYIEPHGNYVISRTNDNVILSRYEDNIWDMSPYSPNQTVNIRFNAIKDTSIRNEAKRLVFLYYLYGSNKYDGAIGGMTLKGFFSSGVRPLSLYVEKGNLTIKQVLESKKHIENYIVSEITNKKHRAQYLGSILKLLESKSNNETGINYIKDKKNDAKISILIKMNMDKHQQTEVIPVSIFLNVLKQRWAHIDRIEPKLNSILEMLDACIKSRAFAQKPNRSTRLPNQKGCWHSQPDYVSWDDAVKRFGLTSLLKYYNITGREMFIKFLSLISATSRHLIHMNTGMRANECRTLQQNCYIPSNDEMPPRIQGVASKISGDPTTQVWVTIEKIKRVIDILVKIGNVIGKHHFPHLKERPLIVSIDPILHYNKSKNKPYKYEKVISASFPKSELPLDEEGIIITQKHLEEELKVIEPLRDWSIHKWIKVGEPWCFKSHQYRRTLAVYALGGGQVSLFSLKEQFGHLLSTMTSYYGNGHLVAKSIDSTDDNKHISKYMETIASELEALSFVHNIQLSKEPLFGAGGVFYETHLRAKTPEAKEQVLESLSDTIRKVKNGEAHCRDTAIGQCTSIAPCDKYLFPSMINYCKECEHNSTVLSKLESSIERKRKFVLYLQNNELGSIQHRTEEQNLLESEKYLYSLQQNHRKRGK